MKKLLFIPVIAFLVVFCGEKPTRPLEVTAKVYVDLMVVKEKYGNNQDSLEHYKQQVFRNYNTSKKEYEKNLAMLGSDNEKWDKFFKLSEAYLDTLKKSESN